MGSEKKLEMMQEELKLLKGELKQSLASVRDYLLNMELPASEFSNILEALDSGEGQKVIMSGSLVTPAENKPAEDARQEIIEPEPETLTADENLIDVEEPFVDESGAPEEDNLDGRDEEPALEETMSAGDEPDEEWQPEAPDVPEKIPGLDAALPPLGENPTVDFEGVSGEAGLATPKVNMLANLIAWVAKAKKEIGYDQLPTFLEVYGISGHLSLELKEVIMQLAQITAERPEVANDPEIWSQAMLSLHGILTGGEAPLHRVLLFPADSDEEIPPDEEEEAAEETPEETPIKLKLVFPTGDGKSKEFCINLTPEEEKPEDNKPEEAKSEVAPRRGKKSGVPQRER
jgi:hypothetical protein